MPIRARTKVIGHFIVISVGTVFLIIVLYGQKQNCSSDVLLWSGLVLIPIRVRTQVNSHFIVISFGFVAVAIALYD